MKLRFSILLVTAILFCGLNADAQRGKHKLANRYYLEYDMKKAAEIYEDIIAKDTTDALALRRAAECRMNVGQTQTAENHLALLVRQETMSSEDYLAYAEVLKRNGKYNEAVNAYKLYTEANPNDPRVYYYFEQEDWLHRIMRDSSRFEVAVSKVNSPQSDFAPNFIGDQVYFSSSRGEGKGRNNIYAWNDQSYLNLFRSTITEDSTLEFVEVLEGKANSRYHEGTAAFDSTKSEIYITRNNYNRGKKKRSKTGTLNLGIFYGSFDGQEIGQLTPFEHNNKEYSVGHPVISTDGNTMYFVSNMPGGSGGTDIYKSVRSGSSWGKPENMGSAINTGGNEMFPFLLDSTLYFSSDGHPGLGGLDVFYTQIGADNQNVVNLGYPMSTEFDDFNAILFNNGRRGYISSNRPGGMGDDDIWEFVVQPVKTVIVSGSVLDYISSLPIPNARIEISDPTGKLVETLYSDEKGNYTIEIDRMEKYTITGIKQGYKNASIEVVDVPLNRYVDDADLRMEPSDFGVKGNVLYAEDDSPVEGAKLTLMDETGIVIEELTTGPDGTYYFGLEGGKVYTLECVKFGYPDQEIQLDTRDKPAEVFNSDFRLFKMEEGAVVRLDNIYYDYDKYEIRSDAAIELNKLVKIMEDNPTMKIELGSHTDSRGSHPYNANLSQKRAQAVVAFLTQKGVSSSRLKSKGYGETRILNKCVDDVECTESEHQLNRRTEFTILEI